MTIPDLGELKTVPLREAWKNEATNFSPWLSEERNMQLLADALSLDSLSLLSREVSVGAFSADLLAEDSLGNRVLIENQLEKSDHDHLGKCLTYAAGLEAKTIIWLCSFVREEHAAAIEFLNEISSNDHSFFAVEIQLFQIGDSVHAPRFNVVQGPNNWKRATEKRAKRAADELSPKQKENRRYWSHLIDVAVGRYPALSRRSPFKGSWQTCEWMSVNSNLKLMVAAWKGADRVRAEIYFEGQLAKPALEYIHSLDASPFEGERDITFEWLENKRDCRIAIYRDRLIAANIEEEQDELCWLVDNACYLASVARGLVSELKENASLEEAHRSDG